MNTNRAEYPPFQTNFRGNPGMHQFSRMENVPQFNDPPYILQYVHEGKSITYNSHQSQRQYYSNYPHHPQNTNGYYQRQLQMNNFTHAEATNHRRNNPQFGNIPENTQRLPQPPPSVPKSRRHVNDPRNNNRTARSVKNSDIQIEVNPITQSNNTNRISQNVNTKINHIQYENEHSKRLYSMPSLDNIQISNSNVCNRTNNISQPENQGQNRHDSHNINALNEIRERIIFHHQQLSVNIPSSTISSNNNIENSIHTHTSTDPHSTQLPKNNVSNDSRVNYYHSHYKDARLIQNAVQTSTQNNYAESITATKSNGANNPQSDAQNNLIVGNVENLRPVYSNNKIVGYSIANSHPTVSTVVSIIENFRPHPNNQMTTYSMLNRQNSSTITAPTYSTPNTQRIIVRNPETSKVIYSMSNNHPKMSSTGTNTQVTMSDRVSSSKISVSAPNNQVTIPSTEIARTINPAPNTHLVSSGARNSETTRPKPSVVNNQTTSRVDSSDISTSIHPPPNNQATIPNLPPISKAAKNTTDSRPNVENSKSKNPPPSTHATIMELSKSNIIKSKPMYQTVGEKPLHADKITPNIRPLNLKLPSPKVLPMKGIPTEVIVNCTNRVNNTTVIRSPSKDQMTKTPEPTIPGSRFRMKYTKRRKDTTLPGAVKNSYKGPYYRSPEKIITKKSPNFSVIDLTEELIDSDKQDENNVSSQTSSNDVEILKLKDDCETALDLGKSQTEESSAGIKIIEDNLSQNAELFTIEYPTVIKRIDTQRIVSISSNVVNTLASENINNLSSSVDLNIQENIIDQSDVIILNDTPILLDDSKICEDDTVYNDSSPTLIMDFEEATETHKSPKTMDFSNDQNVSESNFKELENIIDNTLDLTSQDNTIVTNDNLSHLELKQILQGTPTLNNNDKSLCDERINQTIIIDKNSNEVGEKIVKNNVKSKLSLKKNIDSIKKCTFKKTETTHTHKVITAESSEKESKSISKISKQNSSESKSKSISRRTSSDLSSKRISSDSGSRRNSSDSGSKRIPSDSVPKRISSNSVPRRISSDTNPERISSINSLTDPNSSVPISKPTDSATKDSHTKKHSIKCHRCMKKMPDKVSYAEHKLLCKAHGNKSPKEIKKQIKMNPGIVKLTRLNSTLFQCKYCRSNFLEDASLQKHLKQKHPVSPRRISHHSTSSDSDKSKDPSKKIAEYELMKGYRCGRCRKPFLNKSDMKLHESKHSPKPPNGALAKNVDPVNKSYKCTMCSKPFLSKSVLKLHEQRHLSDNLDVNFLRLFSCGVCKKQFSSNIDLNKHSKTQCAIANTDGDTFNECKTCRKKFASNDIYRLHMQKHISGMLPAEKTIRKIKKVKNA